MGCDVESYLTKWDRNMPMVSALFFLISRKYRHTEISRIPGANLWEYLIARIEDRKILILSGFIG